MLCPQDFSGHSVHIILILSAAGSKLELIKRGAVIQVKLLVIKYCVCFIDASLTEGDLFRLLQGDIAFARIGSVIIILFNIDDLRIQSQPLYSVLGTYGHSLQEIIIRFFRSGFQLQNDIFLISVNVFREISCRVDFLHQLFQDCRTVFSDIILTGLNNFCSIIVPPGKRHNLSFLIVFNLDLRIHA